MKLLLTEILPVTEQFPLRHVSQICRVRTTLGVFFSRAGGEAVTLSSQRAAATETQTELITETTNRRGGGGGGGLTRHMGSVKSGVTENLTSLTNNSLRNKTSG